MSDAKPSSPGLEALVQTAPNMERAAERLLRLQSLALALTGVGTVEQAANVVITEGFAALNATSGAVYLRDADADVFRLARAVGYPAASAPYAPLLPSTDAASPLALAIHARQPLFLEAVTTRRTEASSTPAPAAAIAEAATNADANFALNMPSISCAEPLVAQVALPLLTDDHVLGGLELDWRQAQRFDADARAFMQIVAQMCAQAMERARLYEAEQVARRVAEQAMERAARLQTVTARLAQAITVEQVGEVIISEGTSALSAHRGVLALISPSGGQLEVARVMGYAPATAQSWQRFDLNAPIPLADVVRKREAIWLHNLEERNTRYPQLERIQTSSQAYAVLPLLVDDHVLGGISFGFDHPRGFEVEERAFITALAQQCAQAMERAHLTDAAAAVAAEIEDLNARLKRAMAETHHRVKNNLQVISALVELQTDPGVTQVPADALKRIGLHARALATLHDLLTDQAKVSFETTTVSSRALLGKMLPVLQATIGPRALQSDIADVRLPIRMGASLCLLLSELVSNAVKHGGNALRISLLAAPNRRNPAQAGSIAPPNPDRRQNAPNEFPEQIVFLIVADDGPGFPPNFDPKKAANTGLDLIANISRLDLSGSVTYANNPQGGALVTITFPLPSA